MNLAGGDVTKEPPAVLTADQVRGVLELRGIRGIGAEDLAAVTDLVTALRQQALGLLRAVRATEPAGGPAGGPAGESAGDAPSETASEMTGEPA